MTWALQNNHKRIVRRHDVYVMSDEIYSELTYKEEHVSIASASGNEREGACY